MLNLFYPKPEFNLVYRNKVRAIRMMHCISNGLNYEQFIDTLGTKETKLLAPSEKSSSDGQKWPWDFDKPVRFLSVKEILALDY
jgi:hypothetical protein